MIKLRVSNIQERKGAEILLENAIRKLGYKRFSKNVIDNKSVNYYGVEESVLELVKKHRHWPYIGEVGKFTELQDYIDTVEPRFDTAEDVESEIAAIKTELNQKIQ